MTSTLTGAVSTETDIERAAYDLGLMATIRTFEERVRQLVVQQQVPGAVHLAAGQEAVAVGVCSALEPTDHISSTHRGHGHAIAKGCDLTALFEEILGKVGGVCRGYGGSMHVADFDRGMLGANGVAAGGVPMALGAALSARHLGTGGVAVAFLGDGAVNQGVFAESLTLAAVWHLPVVFVVEDNGYAQATGTAFHLQGIPVARRAEAHGVPARMVDGSDYFDVREAADWAVDHARRQSAPALLECRVARLFPHMEGFDREPYRPAGEVEREWLRRDPLAIARRQMTARGMLTELQLEDIEEAATAQVLAAERRALEAPLPQPTDLTAYVHATAIPTRTTTTKETQPCR